MPVHHVADRVDEADQALGALGAIELVLLESRFKLEPGAGVAAFQRSYAGR